MDRERNFGLSNPEEPGLSDVSVREKGSLVFRVTREIFIDHCPRYLVEFADFSFFTENKDRENPKTTFSEIEEYSKSIQLGVRHRQWPRRIEP